MKKKVRLLVVVMLLSIFCGTQVFAAEKSFETNGTESASEEIVPYAEWVDVPSYQYMLKHYDGSVTIMPVVYKQINVPSGYKVVSNGPTLAYYETDAYYQGTRYAAVSKYEWTHTVVKR